MFYLKYVWLLLYNFQIAKNLPKYIYYTVSNQNFYTVNINYIETLYSLITR